MKKAVFPGSFDPFTIGHEEIVLRALTLFDQILIAIGENTTKKPHFPILDRLSWIERTFDGKPVTVRKFSGLTVDLCKEENIDFIVRGIRSSKDFEYEKSIAEMNKKLHPGIETVFLFSSPLTSFISSTLLREIHGSGGNIQPFIPFKLS